MGIVSQFLLMLQEFFDYDVDSDDEWEEEEPGESLHGSDDEKDADDPEENEYDVDNDFMVPHGYVVFNPRVIIKNLGLYVQIYFEIIP